VDRTGSCWRPCNVYRGLKARSFFCGMRNYALTCIIKYSHAHLSSLLSARQDSARVIGPRVIGRCASVFLRSRIRRDFFNISIGHSEILFALSRSLVNLIWQPGASSNPLGQRKARVRWPRKGVGIFAESLPGVKLGNVRARSRNS